MRFGVLLRQYIGSLSLHASLHTGLPGNAGWLRNKGELPFVQLVAAEVIAASVLLNVDFRGETHLYRVLLFSALIEMDDPFSLPHDKIAE